MLSLFWNKYACRIYFRTLTDLSDFFFNVWFDFFPALFNVRISGWGCLVWIDTSNLDAVSCWDSSNFTLLLTSTSCFEYSEKSSSLNRVLLMFSNSFDFFYPIVNARIGGLFLKLLYMIGCTVSTFSISKDLSGCMPKALDRFSEVIRESQSFW